VGGENEKASAKLSGAMTQLTHLCRVLNPDNLKSSPFSTDQLFDIQPIIEKMNAGSEPRKYLQQLPPCPFNNQRSIKFCFTNFVFKKKTLAFCIFGSFVDLMLPPLKNLLCFVNFARSLFQGLR
jgi:hypothetical protein